MYMVPLMFMGMFMHVHACSKPYEAILRTRFGGGSIRSPSIEYRGGIRAADEGVQPVPIELSSVGSDKPIGTR